MIVKLKTCDNAWVYYQTKGRVTEKVKVRELTQAQYDNAMKRPRVSLERCEVIDDFPNLPEHMKCLTGHKSKMILINFEDKERNFGESLIYTNLSAYLLNDDGKTLEKLN